MKKLLSILFLIFSLISVNAYCGSLNFDYSRLLTINNNTGKTLFSGYNAILYYDTATEIADGRMNSNCSDIRIYDALKDKNVDYAYLNCNTAVTEISFTLDENILNGKSDNNFYLCSNHNIATTDANNYNAHYLYDFTNSNVLVHFTKAPSGIGVASFDTDHIIFNDGHGSDTSVYYKSDFNLLKSARSDSNAYLSFKGIVTETGSGNNYNPFGFGEISLSDGMGLYNQTYMGITSSPTWFGVNNNTSTSYVDMNLTIEMDLVHNTRCTYDKGSLVFCSNNLDDHLSDGSRVFLGINMRSSDPATTKQIYLYQVRKSSLNQPTINVDRTQYNSFDFNINTPSNTGYLLHRNVPFTIDFNVSSADENTAKIDLNFSATNTQGTGTQIVKDLNTATISCDKVDFSLKAKCSYVWNPPMTSVGNYYIIGYARNATETKFDAGNNTFNLNSPTDMNIIQPNGGQTITTRTYNINLNINLKDANNINLDLNYGSTNTQGTGTIIATNIDTSTLNCSPTDYSKNTTCTYVWDLRTVLSGTYYLKALITSDANSVFKVSTSTFTVALNPDINFDSMQISGIQISQTQNNQDIDARIDFNIMDVDSNSILIDLNYSSSINQGTGTKILDDINIANASNGFIHCDDLNFINSTHCYYDWNTTNVADNTYYLLISATDQAGNLDFNKTNYSFIVDQTKPETTTSNDSLWHTSNYTVTLNCTDSGTECNYTKYRINLASWIIYEGDLLFSNEAENLLNYYSVDNVGNIENTKTTTVYVDKTKPVTTSDNNNAKWNNANQNITLSCSDATSGCNTTKYRVNLGNWNTYTGTKISFTTDANWHLDFNSTDIAGNIETTNNQFVLLDKTNPTTTSTNDSLWHNTDYSVTLNCFDATSGCDLTNYRVDLGAWIEYSSPILFNTDGSHRLDFNSIDKANNNEVMNTTTVYIDENKPITTANNDNLWHKINQTITLFCTDNTSGCKNIHYRVNNGAWQQDPAGLRNQDSNKFDDKDSQNYSVPIIISTDGNNQIDFYSTDYALNVETIKTIFVLIDKINSVLTFLAPLTDATQTTNTNPNFQVLLTDNLSGLNSYDGNFYYTDIGSEDFAYEVLLPKTDVNGLSKTLLLNSGTTLSDGQKIKLYLKLYDYAGNVIDGNSNSYLISNSGAPPSSPPSGGGTIYSPINEFTSQIEKGKYLQVSAESKVVYIQANQTVYYKIYAQNLLASPITVEVDLPADLQGIATIPNTTLDSTGKYLIQFTANQQQSITLALTSTDVNFASKDEQIDFIVNPNQTLQTEKVTLTFSLKQGQPDWLTNFLTTTIATSPINIPIIGYYFKIFHLLTIIIAIFGAWKLSGH